MQEAKTRIDTLEKDFVKIKSNLKVKEKENRVALLEKESAEPDFWSDQVRARGVMLQIGQLKDELSKVNLLEKKIGEVKEVYASLKEDQSLLMEIGELEEMLEDLKIKSLLSGEYDQKNALVSLHAGQGGVEAMDWASMLYRMYLKFCERKGFLTTTIDLSQGEEAGIKSVVFEVEGIYAYGYLKGESGTHRLVRQSPFNADKLRQTSFASVGVLPQLAEVDLPDIKIKDDDLEWQFFRASTQGGQNVQKVSTAVRVKHLPTGLVVTAQTQRFQEQNRKIALDLLRAKLWVLAKEEKNAREKAIKGEYKPASWGNQIRSYVLHPYKMVKDLRTRVETSDTEGVLNGQIEEFIEANLHLKS